MLEACRKFESEGHASAAGGGSEGGEGKDPEMGREAVFESLVEA